ncbi:diguanylate phosphodiesterase [Marinobacter vulgaris]|uniref:Diguanylate phosphodiesterase n=1 Tax=Marinobacter vulgaris TaxID=1928331 RepID=A0A2V3ZNS2_9GAMM|nr:EAL domain-containing protein [Marinobacter vulgaris]PXX92621.1 diguanylate phosphodiesterase [Marinobacter vulgaris]TSJ71436.1 EAL domain-containing protein [Marinobacter vulgaris]
MAIASRIGFRGRLVTAMVALVAVVSLSIGALLMLYLFEDEKARALEQLNLGERVAEEVLERRTSLILARLDVVVRDFGFRSAIASGDRPTADSALANQAMRVGADFALLLGRQGKVLAEAGSLPPALIAGSLPDQLLSRVRQSGFASQMHVLDDKGVELLAIPVEAPGLRAWLIAGFQIDGEVSDIIGRLSGTEVLFRTTSGAGGGEQFLSEPGKSAPARRDELTRAVNTASGDQGFVESTHYFIRIIDLTKSKPQSLQLLLLINRDASLSNYYRRAVEILLLVSTVLALAALIALLIARNMGKPVLQLADYAKAIGDGHTPKPPRIRAGGELAQLRQAFGDMLAKLRDREDQIRYAASHDEITGLSSRNAFLERLREQFDLGRQGSLMGLRLNDLSDVNDTLGLEFGDKVLRAVAARLEEQLPERSFVARTGGGEFLMITEHQSDASLEVFATRLRDVVESPLMIDNTPFSLRCTLVTLQLPDDAIDTDQVRRRLNLTFEQAHKNRLAITHYQPGRDENHLRELQLISDLHSAITSNGLHMNYQPKLDMQGARCHQAEALVRWIHPELGFISPEEFIFLAEQSGQITDLTRHILHRVAEDASQWHSAGMDIGVAVNLSALDLSRPQLAEDVAAAFSRWQLPMSRITLEVTESAVMEDPQTALETLRRLRRLGVTLSVDDFGTGYSSLSQLRNLPVQELKIDKSFILQLDAEPQDQLIVRSTIDMAHGLGLRVVAEGIENLESWHLLRRWGCELGQGFFLSRPVAAADLKATEQSLASRQHELTDPGEATP